ncbi:hypothetical protein WT60_17400 [Burkholderia sp. MSMB617WGS]|nr:hypothetical protein WT60_17400 [Burkholderia sp. MSMB617WGS]
MIDSSCGPIVPRADSLSRAMQADNGSAKARRGAVRRKATVRRGALARQQARRFDDAGPYP